ncbi:MAG: hypothetical protein ACQEP8_05070, partial [Chlamydiota bacterium]
MEINDHKIKHIHINPETSVKLHQEALAGVRQHDIEEIANSILGLSTSSSSEHLGNRTINLLRYDESHRLFYTIEEGEKVSEEQSIEVEKAPFKVTVPCKERLSTISTAEKARTPFRSITSQEWPALVETFNTLSGDIIEDENVSARLQDMQKKSRELAKALDTKPRMIFKKPPARDRVLKLAHKYSKEIRKLAKKAQPQQYVEIPSGYYVDGKYTPIILSFYNKEGSLNLKVTALDQEQQPDAEGLIETSWEYSFDTTANIEDLIKATLLFNIPAEGTERQTLQRLKETIKREGGKPTDNPSIKRTYSPQSSKLLSTWAIANKPDFNKIKQLELKCAYFTNYLTQWYNDEEMRQNPQALEELTELKAGLIRRLKKQGSEAAYLKTILQSDGEYQQEFQALEDSILEKQKPHHTQRSETLTESYSRVNWETAVQPTPTFQEATKIETPQAALESYRIIEDLKSTLDNLQKVKDNLEALSEKCDTLIEQGHYQEVRTIFIDAMEVFSAQRSPLETEDLSLNEQLSTQVKQFTHNYWEACVKIQMRHPMPLDVTAILQSQALMSTFFKKRQKIALENIKKTWQNLSNDRKEAIAQKVREAAKTIYDNAKGYYQDRYYLPSAHEDFKYLLSLHDTDDPDLLLKYLIKENKIPQHASDTRKHEWRKHEGKIVPLLFSLLAKEMDASEEDLLGAIMKSKLATYLSYSDIKHIKSNPFWGWGTNPRAADMLGSVDSPMRYSRNVLYFDSPLLGDNYSIGDDEKDFINTISPCLDMFRAENPTSIISSYWETSEKAEKEYHQTWKKIVIEGQTSHSLIG